MTLHDPCLLLDQSSSEVIQRVAQVERELALYQQQTGPFTRPSVRANAKTMEPSSCVMVADIWITLAALMQVC